MSYISKEDAIKKINENNGDFQVFTKDEHETFLGNLKNTEVFKNQLSSRVSELHGNYDTLFADETGKKRSEGEKTSDFARRTLKEFKEDVATKSQKITDLEKAVEDGTGNVALEQAQRELSNYKNTHNTAMEEWEGKYSDLEGSVKTMRVTNEIDKAMSGLVFKDTKIISEEVRTLTVDAVKSELAKTGEIIQDKLVFKDRNGETVLDKNLDPITAQELLKAKLKIILNEGRNQPGPGVTEKGPVITKDDKGNIDVTLVVPDTVKTNADLAEFLSKSGLKRSGTAEEQAIYFAALSKYGEGLKKV